MLILWPVISWLNQEMPIIVNCSWGPQNSCRLHCLSYIFARYPHISIVYFVCVTSSCLPKSFNLLIDVLSYVRVPTCPSFNPISSLRAFEPSHHISPSLSYLPILTPISPLRSIALYQPIAIPLARLISSLRFITVYQPIAIMFPLTCPPTWPLHWLYLLECDNALWFAVSTGSEHHGVIGSRLDCTAFQQVHGIANSARWIFLFDPLIVFIRQGFSLHHAL